MSLMPDQIAALRQQVWHAAELLAAPLDEDWRPSEKADVRGYRQGKLAGLAIACRIAGAQYEGERWDS